jgi:mono/diheme cytochrome c family protein
MKWQICWAIVSVTLVIGTGIVASGQEQPASKPTDSANHSAEEGKKVFTQRCATCHKTDSETKTIGPGLKGLGGSSRKFITTDTPVTDEALRKWILKGDGLMPPFEKVLNDKQVDDLVTYLKTL